MTACLESMTELEPLLEFSTTDSNGNYIQTRQRDKLLARFGDRITVNPDLSRALVSWQLNKRAAGFRWFKFKEGFSVELVRYLLGFLENRGLLLDPFAGY